MSVQKVLYIIFSPVEKNRECKEFFMKKFAFLAVLAFLTVSLFAQAAGDYAKILKGDLSAFAGYWVNGNGERWYLRSNGTFSVKGGAARFSKGADGVYRWSVSIDDGPGGGVMLLPVGVETPYYDVKTDTTRVRLHVGQEAPGTPEDYFYKESVFPPVTHVTSENLKIRTWQNLNSETVTVLKKGTKVLVQEWGNMITIDGTSAKWAHVFTSDGFEGWCFSGFLQEL
jgi:hypothetical protein